MRPTLALVRPPSSTFAHVISSHPLSHQIDLNRALNQHRQYCQALEQAGAEVMALEPLDEFPDSTFIEDNAVILEGCVWLTCMKAVTRSGESILLKPVLEKYLPVRSLRPPAFLDGGDVLATESAVFIGQSERTTSEACAVLQRELTTPVIPVPVHNRLHLKTVATFIGRQTLLINKKGCDAELFSDFNLIEVADEEAYAANCLALGDQVIMPAGFSRVKRDIEKAGFYVLTVEMSEFEKADGGITCLSLFIPR